MRDLLSLNFLEKSELLKALDLADWYKKNRGRENKILSNKNIGLLFFKKSTRTFISFQIGINQLGGNSIILDPSQLQISRGEILEHTAKTFNSYLDALIIRCNEHQYLNELSKYSTIPILNALSDDYHPCQVMADMQVIRTYCPNFSSVHLAFLGDCSSNIANSLILASYKFGFNLYLIGPKDFQAKLDTSNYDNIISSDDLKLLKNCNFIYTDTWISMGKESEQDTRLQKLKKFQLNKKLLELVEKKPYIMHCLPAHLEQEITEEMLKSEYSIVWEQVENRLHIQKALMELKFLAR